MATVPRIDNPTVDIAPLPNARVAVDVNPLAFGAGQAREMQQAGQKLGQFGDMVAERAIAMQSENNEYEAKSLDLEFNQRAREIRQKYLDTSGIDAMNGLAGAEAEIAKLRQDTGRKASNNHVAMMFGQVAQARADSYLDQFGQHAATQRRGYLDATDDAQVATALNDGALSWMRPVVADTHYNVGLNAVYAKAERNGLSGESTLFAVKQYRSSFYEALTAQAISQDPANAMAHLKRAQSMLSAEGYAKLYSAAKAQDDLNKASTSAQAIYNEALRGAFPQMMAITPDGRDAAVDAVFTGLIAQESGGDPNAVSPKGAFGVAQLMPETAVETARKLGIEPTPDNLANPAINEKLGKAYLREQLEAFDGNMVLALAAYNAGPGKVGEWLDKYGDPRTGVISSEEWARKIPYKETRAYIPDVLRKSGITAEQPANKVAGLEAAKAQAMLAIVQMPQTDGTKLIKSQTEAMFDAQISSAKAGLAEAKTQAWGALLKGERFSQLPAALIGNLAEGDQRAMMEWDAKRDTIKTDPTRLSMLMTMREVDPAGFASIDPAEAATYLDKDNFRWFADEQAAIKGGKEVDAGRKAFMTIAEEYAQGPRLGFAESRIKKDPTGTEAQNYALWMNRAREVYNVATAKGDKLNDTRARQMLDELSAGIALDSVKIHARVEYGPGYRAPTGGVREFDLPEIDGPAYKLTLAQIPKPLLSAIDQAIVRAGDSVDDITRLNYYIAMLKAETDAQTAAKAGDAVNYGTPAGDF
jgi:soluble lytic murein transglycosylase-like protein